MNFHNFALEMRILLFLTAFATSVLCYSQDNPNLSDAISDCSGASNILQPGSFKLQFPSKGGQIKDLAGYPSLANVQEKNSLWCSFKAPYTGRLTLDADVSSGTVQMIVFENETKDVCDDIFKGKAEIRRLILSQESHVGLNLITSTNTLYPIDLVAGKHIMICFLSNTKERPSLDLHVRFDPTDGEIKATGESEDGKVVDLRHDKDVEALSILIRDVETGNPVVANMTINGIRDLSALYNGSDFLITVERSGKIQIKVDAEGYFFVDKEEPVSAGSENELVIWLEPLGEGKSMQIDEIEFVPGSSEFLPTAEPKLKRLKDFLALNAQVKVEIQGHVHATGENSFAAQKLSEARAKRVMMYLVDNGISKDRLTSVGFGNTKPIYKDAKFAYEEQANRRVEIKVL
jgi:outer membrane protein OmpA-like peptidoglycan-associated protein